MQDTLLSTFEEPNTMLDQQQAQANEECDYFHCPFSGSVFLFSKHGAESAARPPLYHDISDDIEDSLDDSELDDIDIIQDSIDDKALANYQDDTASSCSDSNSTRIARLDKFSPADDESKPNLQPQPPRPHETSVTVHSRRVSSSVQAVQITAEMLAEHFHESLEVAASKIGIGKSTMKIVCRRLGIEKWPYVHTGSRKRRPRAATEKRAKRGEMNEEVGSEARTHPRCTQLQKQ